VLARGLSLMTQVALLMAFSAGLVVSHYGMTYAYLIINVVGIATQYVWRQKSPVLTFGSVILYMVMAISWYMYVASGAAFAQITQIGDHFVSSLLAAIFSPETRQILRVAAQKELILHRITGYLQIIVTIFISVGILKLVLKRGVTKFGKEYFALSVGAFAILGAIFVVPNFSYMTYGPSRGFLICLVVLAPLFALGGNTLCGLPIHLAAQVIKGLPKRAAFSHKTLVRMAIEFPGWVDVESGSPSIGVKVLSLFSVAYLLFNTGFIYQVTNDPQKEFTLDNTAPMAVFSKPEEAAAIWVSANVRDTGLTYTDAMSRNLFLRYYPDEEAPRGFRGQYPPLQEPLYLQMIPFDEGRYIILRVTKLGVPFSLDYALPQWTYGKPYRSETEYVSPSKLTWIGESNMIYDNGGVEVLLTR
jgi:uncharacterized membrane protein